MHQPGISRKTVKICGKIAGTVVKTSEMYGKIGAISGQTGRTFGRIKETYARTDKGSSRISRPVPARTRSNKIGKRSDLIART